MSRRRQSKRRIKSLMGMIALTGMLSVFSTYAWFSTNRVVTLSNIHAQVAAAEGLQISLDGETWSSSVDFSQDVFETTKIVDGAETVVKTTIGSVNKYNWPEELNPVSTGGTTEDGDLVFYAADVKNDGANLGSVAENTKNFISFDIYFKNASSSTADYGDFLQLNAGSSVTPGTAEKTGLENSVRIGLLLYGETTGVTSDGATVRDLAAVSGTKMPRVSIWEPNSQKHIQEIINNDARINNNTPQDTTDDVMDFRTLGLIGIPTVTDKVNVSAVSAGVNDSFLQKQHTLQTTSGEVSGATYMPLTSSTAVATGDSAIANAAAANYLSLPANSITKARLYIWLEGQDPDCVDVASTGKSLDILLSFTKPGGTTTSSN